MVARIFCFLLDKLSGTKLLGFLTLAVAGREGDNVLALHGSSPLDRQMAQATDANNTDSLVGTSAMIIQRRKSGQTSAEQRGSYVCADTELLDLFFFPHRTK